MRSLLRLVTLTPPDIQHGAIRSSTSDMATGQTSPAMPADRPTPPAGTVAHEGGAKRIQRKRTRGWRMPEGAVYVGRGSIWGNPFIVGAPSGIFDGKDGRPLGVRDEVEIIIPTVDLETSLSLYRDLVSGFVSPEMYPFGHQWSRDMHKKCGGHPSEIARAFLRGKSLACWCSLADRHGNYVPCHADVLLSIANDIPMDEVIRENTRRAERQTVR